ncbi:AMP-binding protein [Leptolyngbya sp. FACHB-711]|uniref:AMP-dependent synthetase/ligase n=1 Tax=unclassified Leptolyngbya TaxID=2650499 RepID=UPI0018F0212E|nr:AMP-binding protein [Leptolyngbya sp. FACHB-711]
MTAAAIQPTFQDRFDYSKASALPDIWAIVTQSPDVARTIALRDPHGKLAIELTYGELYQQIQWFAAGLQSLGIQSRDHIALFSDNSPRWLVADQGMMLAGVVNAVRGAQADREELLFILEHSDSVALVVQDKETLGKIAAGFPDLPLRFVIVLSDETLELENLRVIPFSEVIEMGKSHPLQPVALSRDMTATLMYTSGTSGQPKGVMLSHHNLLSQVMGAYQVAQPQPGERVLSILPIWHCYERTFEYFVLSHGCTQTYTSIRTVKKDLKDVKPHYMVGVPRLWESIYEGVQKQFREQPIKKQNLVKFFLEKSDRFIRARRLVQGLCLDNLKPSIGEKLKASLQMAALWVVHQAGDRLVYRKIREATGGEVNFLVSGGGSIAEHLEDFYEIIGVTILGGYGLTETSPITHVRRPWRNLRSADGEPLPHTETRIVDPETRHILPIGQQGLVLIRGHQVMQGYYKNPQATAKAIDSEGWFDTGDLGVVTEFDDLIITGRAKDTIVLTNGENIEPQPIEDVCLRSPYIDQMMLVGQDQKVLGALIVPNLDALHLWAVNQNLALKLPSESPTSGGEPMRNSSPEGVIDLDSKPVQELFRQELNREVKNRPGYRADDRIGPFRLLLEPFTIENGMLTQTLKIRRNVVVDRYRKTIDEMFV